MPKKSGLNQRQRWIAFGAKPRGRISVDDGAKKALQARKSLLAVGIIKCCGSFDDGDIVCVCDREGIEFARGKASVGAGTVEKAMGGRFDKEIIHRDNIVILE
ncbi:MAG: hypothetical protein PHT59_05280 [Candidatus Omnitrophica bacterium]|nr:hypothetical protein [Candidatus Omnitrophota bacterium]